MPALTEEQRRDDLRTIRMIDKIICSRTQIDGGANISCTNDETILYNVVNTPVYYIGGIGKGIRCSKRDIFFIQCNNGKKLPVHMFYSSEAKETVVSPTDTVTSHTHKFDNRQETCNVEKGIGSVRFYLESGIESKTIELQMSKKQWYFKYTRRSLTIQR